MKSDILRTLFIGLAAIGLASCATQAGQGSGGAPGWDVEFTVTEDSNGAVTIKVAPYQLDLTNGPPGQRPLRFKLTSTTFSYVMDKNRAIEIKNNAAGQFFDHVRGSGGRMMTVKDKNDDGLLYQYILRIEDSSGRTIELDPLIKNRN